MKRKLKVSARSCKSTSPPWVVNLGYDLFAWMAHHLACKVIPIGLIWPPSCSYTGGSASRSCEWSDQPTGPTGYRNISLRWIRGVYSWRWIVAARVYKYATPSTPDGLHSRTKQYIRQEWGRLCLVLNDLKKLRLFKVVRSSSLRTRTQ